MLAYYFPRYFHRKYYQTNSIIICYLQNNNDIVSILSGTHIYYVYLISSSNNIGILKYYGMVDLSIIKLMNQSDTLQYFDSTPCIEVLCQQSKIQP